MKSIGIIDFYISEWHANNYPQWLREVCAEQGLDYEVRYAWAEQELSPYDGRTTDEWCLANHAERCGSIAELCQRSDVILILAPSDPEKHLAYAKEALPFGKPTFIDKTFAPCLAEAEEIYRIADRYHTPIFSTSALRYAEELELMREPSALIVNGGGSNFPEYAVHMVEMAVLLMQSPVEQVQVLQQGNQKLCRMTAKNGIEATLIYSPSMPFVVSVDRKNIPGKGRAIQSDYFRHLMRDIIRFFETAVPSFDRRETLEVIRVRDALLEADRTPGAWLSI